MSRSLVPQEARDLFNKLDSMADYRNKIAQIADSREEWAGIPVPLKDIDLIIEPRYPNAQVLMEITNKKTGKDPIADDPTFKFRNSFMSMHKRRNVLIWEVNGKINWGLEPPGNNKITMLMNTLEASAAWGIEQESAALTTLGTLIKHVAFKHYCLTGTFLETSQKSGVHYLFRRLRPTIAISTTTGYMKVITALCLHPIAYYRDSWAGAMCPTDDVIAHLMLMRGDEHMLWRRANQHPSWLPQSGL